MQDFVGRTIYVWFYILLLSLFAQNFDFVQCLISDFDTLHKDNFENFLSLFYRYYIFMYVWLLLIIFYLNLYLLFYFYNYILYIRISFPNLFFVFWPQQCSLPGWQFAFSLSLIEGAYHNARLFLCRFASSPSADRLHECSLLTCKCPHNGLGSLPVSSIRHPRSGQGDNMPGRRNVPSFRLFGSMIE